jgi:FlaA1/EpsC-like NDP-sugar epimerase
MIFLQNRDAPEKFFRLHTTSINKYYRINQIIFKMSTALITGASGEIGKAFADELAACKKNLVPVARSSEKLNQINSHRMTIKTSTISRYYSQIFHRKQCQT